MSDELDSTKPQYGIGTILAHPMFGKGKILAYEGRSYVMVFRGGEAKRVSFSFEGLTPVVLTGEGATDALKEALREVLGEHGWIDIELEMGSRWVGGQMTLEPGKTDTQPKSVPIEAFFKKLIGVREKLRVLEQKINNHPSLAEEEKLELEGYITRCYGSLTTFNSLFSAKELQFKGTGRTGSDEG